MQQGDSPVAQGHGANVAAFSYVPLLTTHYPRLTTYCATESPTFFEQARTYFRQLISGVEYCHRQGVSRRHLQP